MQYYHIRKYEGSHFDPLHPLKQELENSSKSILFLCTDRIYPGCKVWWNDPAGETSDFYDVINIGSDDNMHYDVDTIILLKNEFSEVEAYPDELVVIVGAVPQKCLQNS